MSDVKKCGNPACSCAAAKGEDYCSTHCEGSKETTEIMCRCGHAGCRGNASKLKLKLSATPTIVRLITRTYFTCASVQQD